MKKIFLYFIMSATLFVGCKSAQKSQTGEQEESGMNKTEKGAVIGASSGAVIGGIIGNNNKNTALGAILGAAVGGTIGAVIGNKMDKQAEEIQEELGEAATVERVGEGIKLTFNEKLLFDFGKSSLKESNKRNLQKFAETLNEYADTELLIVGHTDNVGSETFNQTLSTERAAAVSNYLEAVGVSSNRIKIQGEGELEPYTSNDTEEGRMQNRRVEIAIYASDKMKTEAKKASGN